MQSPTFADLMQRVRGGDEQAVRTLVEEYGDAIRREVRFSLLDGRVRRFVSESDICQSVLTKLCLGLWAGSYEIDDPAQLIGLLKTMVHARVIDWTRHERAQRRDIRRSVPLDSNVGDLPASKEESPSQIVAEAELVARLKQSLSTRELQVLEYRQQRLMWPKIAQLLGGDATPEAVRKQHERALERAIDGLGLED